MYVPRVCEVLDTLNDRAILVGHSSGGMIISEAARQRSNCISGLVFLSAFLLPPGKTPRTVIEMDNESMLPRAIEIDVEKGVSSIKAECARMLFYEDCSVSDAEWAMSRLQPEPLIPPGLSFDSQDVGESGPFIPRFYIECLQDRALSPRTQQWMYAESACDAVYSLNTSHSPFLSAPEALSRYLIEIAGHTSCARKP
jgi:pimeloyl-ACP methyl ester carboxylesterase